jgi:hypothetical protein
VDASANRSKADKDPAQWLPENKAYRVQYAKDWADVKARWGLTADPAEMDALRKILGPSRAKIWLKNVKRSREKNCRG